MLRTFCHQAVAWTACTFPKGRRRAAKLVTTTQSQAGADEQLCPSTEPPRCPAGPLPGSLPAAEMPAHPRAAAAATSAPMLSLYYNRVTNCNVWKCKRLWLSLTLKIPRTIGSLVSRGGSSLCLWSNFVAVKIPELNVPKALEAFEAERFGCRPLHKAWFYFQSVVKLFPVPTWNRFQNKTTSL